MNAHLCIDERGYVTAVSMVGAPTSADATVQRALAKWRFRPYLDGGVATPACFTIGFSVGLE